MGGQRWTQVCRVWGGFYSHPALPYAGSVYTGMSLDIDADRDGVVEKNNPNKVTRPLPLHTNPTGLQEPELAKPQWGILGKLDLGGRRTRGHPACRLQQGELLH